MTPDELITLTQQHVGNRSSATITDAWYLARVQSGYNRLATFQGYVQRPGQKQPQFRRVRFYELQHEIERTISSSLTNNFVANSTGVYSVDGLWNNTDGVRIDGWPHRKMMTVDKTATGYLRYWCPDGKSNTQGYRVYKIPTSDVTVTEYVYNLPETLSEGGSAPVIPSEWHTAIHLAAGAEAAELLRMPDQSMALEQRFLAFIAERKSPYEEAKSRGGFGHFHVGRPTTARLQGR